MAEVTIPEEETVVEEEEEEEVLPVVEKPTDKSKVISVDFNPLNTKQTTSLDTRESFYTTDTDAWIVLNVGDMNEPTGQYSLALINKEDGSIFQRTGDIVNGVAYYKLLPNEIKHAGRWVGQAVITLANGQTTASRFSFNVSGHILDVKDVREIVIQDFQTLMKQLNDLKDNSTNEFGILKNEIEAFQIIAQENEDNRQATELERVAAEKEREENYESKVTAAIVEADVVTKVDDKVAELSPTIQQVTAHLAQNEQNTIVELNKKALKTETNAQLFDLNLKLDSKVGGGKKAEPEDLSATTLGLINGTGGPINILSTPQDKSVTDKKLDDSLADKLILNANNLAPNGDFLNGTTNWTYTDNTSNVEIKDGLLTVTGLGNNTSVYVYGPIPAKKVGHEYYYRVEARADQKANQLRIYSGSDINTLSNPNPESFHVLSGIAPYNTNTLFGVYARYANPSEALDKKLQIKKMRIIDVTEMFSPNARPSKEVLDYIFAKHDDSAFNGVKNMLSGRKNLVNQAQKEIDLKTMFGNGVLQGFGCRVLSGLSVQVEGGKAYFNSTIYDVTAKTFVIEEADTTNARTDLIFIDNTGVLRIEKGKPVSWSEVPILPEDALAVAEIKIPAQSTSVDSGDIIDRRIFIKNNKLSEKVSTVIVAASNSTPQDKAIADYVCDGLNDESEIQKAVDSFVRSSGKVILANGDYYIDSLYNSGDADIGKFGIVMKKPTIQREIKITGMNAPSRNYATSNTITNTPNIILRKALYDSLTSQELVTIIGVLPILSGTGVLYPVVSLVTKNLTITIPDNKKNTRMIDAYNTNMFKCDSFMGMYQIFTGHNIQAEGIRGVRGMNAGTGYEISNSFVWGAGIAYNISGEHLIMKNCGVRYSLYPFAFGLTPEQWRNAHPNTIINCCDEGCTNGILFGDNPNKQSVNFIDYNMEVGKKINNAVEQVPGAFVGKVEYAVVGYPSEHDYINVDYPFWKEGSGINFRTRNLIHKDSGESVERPIFPNRNQTFFDTSINKMLIYVLGKWVDMLGNEA